MKFLEKSLFALVVALFFVPLFGALPAARETVTSYVALHWDKGHSLWENGRDFFLWYQRERLNWAAAMDRGFLGRDFLIKWTGEIWFRVFDQSAVRSIKIYIGKTGTLFEENYLREYCLLRSSPAKIEPLVKDIKRLQSTCERLSIGFALVITPSKAAIYPEEIPSAWMRRCDSRPRTYEVMLPLLNKYGVHYVDGHRITAQIKNSAPVPVFPKGGIHWASYAGWATSNEVIARLQEQGMPLQRFEIEDASFGDQPAGDDMDLLRMMNLARPWYYPVMRFNIKQTPTRPLTATFVGDSFNGNMVRHFANSGQFSEIDWFYYYTALKFSLPRAFNGDVYSDLDNSLATVEKPVKHIDFNREIFGSDCLILETNESLMNDMPHFKRFLADANRQLSSAAREPFRYESALPYAWGQTLSFASKNRGKLCGRFLDGYSEAEQNGTWTDGEKATLRLHPPAPNGDILLEAELEPMLDAAKFSEQRVKVCINDRQIDEWSVPAGMRRYTARIPRACVAGDEIIALQFKISNPVSPLSIGLSPDKRKLGISVAKIRLSNEDDLDGNFLPCRWGGGIPFGAQSVTESGYSFLSGFSANEPRHCWTDGPQATVKLSVPRTNYDLKLTARVSAFIPPGKQQEVNIYANGHLSGKWVFGDPQETTRTLAIPHDFLDNGSRLTLLFEISAPTSPVSIGQENDIRKLGICFSQLNLATSSEIRASFPGQDQQIRCSSSALAAPTP